MGRQRGLGAEQHPQRLDANASVVRDPAGSAQSTVAPVEGYGWAEAGSAAAARSASAARRMGRPPTMLMARYCMPAKPLINRRPWRPGAGIASVSGGLAKNDGVLPRQVARGFHPLQRVHGDLFAHLR